MGALAGGGGLINDPSGKGNNISLDWLKHTPFKDYFVPGLILFTCNGLFGIVVLWMIFREAKKYPLFIFLQGILLNGWIVIQIILLHTINFLQITFGGIGIVLIILGVLQMKQSKRLS